LLSESSRKPPVVHPEAEPQASRDSKDNKFLAAAAAADAEFIVSADKDLLDLQEYEGVAIVTAEEFLRSLQRAQAA